MNGRRSDVGPLGSRAAAGSCPAPPVYLTDSQEVDGAREFCTCGNPDPLNEDHIPTCAMLELIDLLGYLPGAIR